MVDGLTFHELGFYFFYKIELKRYDWYVLKEL